MLDKIISLFKPEPGFFQQQAAIKAEGDVIRFHKRSEASKKGWEKRKKRGGDNAQQ